MAMGHHVKDVHVAWRRRKREKQGERERERESCDPRT
jgi:hypothetical protein